MFDPETVKWCKQLDAVVELHEKLVAMATVEMPQLIAKFKTSLDDFRAVFERVNQALNTLDAALADLEC